MKFVYHDGGRKEAGFKGSAGDCVVRAIAIAAEVPYRQVYDDLKGIGENYTSIKRTKIAKTMKASPRNGVHRPVYQPYIQSLGFIWHPTMHVGSGCVVHLKEDELPEGRLIVSLSRHMCAVIDGVLYDTFDCTRDGTRCVYGYFKK